MKEETERRESKHNGVTEQRTPLGTKKTYIRPGLVEYGSIGKLTQTASTGNADANTMRSCL